MKYAIVYSSRTGNTKMLADHLIRTLPTENCVYAGEPAPEALEAELLFVGFWTDRGSCNQETSDFLASVREKKIFLFGTAGFGLDPSYYETILGVVSEKLTPGNTLVGTYMCQGKMPISVRERYEKMLEDPETRERAQRSIRNFDMALTHPDQKDINGLAEAVKRI